MTQTNALGDQTSPYLLQHAHNPVHWHPWSDQALQLAREQDKPILLSIGYSACHWCHVMAHESFEDADTARVMNEHFINIKVDREERPDLDKIYQRTHQLLTQRPGGWPLTVFLMPDDHVPFFAGTYFPKEPRYGMPAFTDLLMRIAEFYRDHRDQLETQNRSLLEALHSLQPSPGASDRLTPAPLDAARQQLQSAHDDKHGGFGQAPKFPHPTNIERLLRHWASSEGKDSKALEMACFNLRKMALGGIHDQIGGGFCRYSVDDYWMIPHFEKMLYDNGPLLCLYSEAWSATGDAVFRHTVHALCDWLLREMQSPEGGFYSSIDADSEGEEGKFYVWPAAQIKAALTSDEFAVFARIYGIDREPNFEGRYYPHTFVEAATYAEQHDMALDEVNCLLASARRKLFALRQERIHPARDDKILTAWNGLMIKGLASAGRRLGNPAWTQAALSAVDFIRQTLWDGTRLLATYKAGKAHLNAYLDDYAFLIDGLLECLQAQWRDEDLQFALQLADVLLQQFEDRERGGFYFTSADHESLLERLKPFGDDATPSGNGVAALCLLRLHHLTGESRYANAAERTLKAAWGAMEQIPYAHNALLHALEEWLYPTQTVVVRGADQASLTGWQQRLQRAYAPRRQAYAIPADTAPLPGLLAERQASADLVTAYLCQGTHCQAPITDWQAFDKACRVGEYQVEIEWQ